SAVCTSIVAGMRQRLTFSPRRTFAAQYPQSCPRAERLRAGFQDATDFLEQANSSASQPPPGPTDSVGIVEGKRQRVFPASRRSPPNEIDPRKLSICSQAQPRG